ncbi:IS110 family transposase [Roseomonas sp. SSH11]|uniref:IS110 family transposase n=1 Tax=Pararoseomonas baculiformis TaxID=2820812 RepID=A0ABS4AFJ9_9PROT|nr:IS110 family transposase [Pararoseomonas baculiformis]
MVEALQAVRGVSLIVDSALVAEVGDFRRFDNPRQLMAYLGLVPSEHSSGAKRRQGASTKAGKPARAPHARQGRLDLSPAGPGVSADAASLGRIATGGARHCLEGTCAPLRPVPPPAGRRQAAAGCRDGHRA